MCCPPQTVEKYMSSLGDMGSCKIWHYSFLLIIGVFVHYFGKMDENLRNSIFFSMVSYLESLRKLS